MKKKAESLRYLVSCLKKGETDAVHLKQKGAVRMARSSRVFHEHTPPPKPKPRQQLNLEEN